MIPQRGQDWGVHTFCGCAFCLIEWTVGWSDDECGRAQITVSLIHGVLNGTVQRLLIVSGENGQLPRARSDREVVEVQ